MVGAGRTKICDYTSNKKIDDIAFRNVVASTFFKIVVVDLVVVVVFYFSRKYVIIISFSNEFLHRV